ncbi:Camsap1 [Symbiodinium sp. CCMP2456]|nr:Camsap1 [Symbiodinium sp. CCMP2456]
MLRRIRFLSALHAWLIRGLVSAAAPEQKGREGPGPRVMLSVITRNRFWRHALSTLSLRSSVENAQQELPDLHLEWHLIDDASSGSKSSEKQSMIQELVEAGQIRNFTRMSRHLGTVRVLALAVETFLSRADLDFFLHCDDDILMGRTTVVRALRDYMTDITDGGILALFVNSWLDDQLSHADPAFGPYAVAPFLGGAAYIVDRKTLTVTGNPWAQAIASNNRITPHEAHVFWLRQLLPSRGQRIWVRWKQPYECQHLGNVNTMNFGRQPEWEPMWAIDHESKRVVEVPGYTSADVRAALWNDRKLLPDYVAFQNAKMRNPLKQLPSTETSGAWSPWAYRRRHLNYLEIGTADFDTLLSRHVWREDVHGISVEPLRIYFDRLPSHGGANKLLLNVAVSDYDGFDTLYFVQPELVGPHRGSESLCDQALLSKLGLDECLPGWVRGTSSLKRPPEGVRQLLGKRAMDVMGRVQVPCMTYETLLTVYGIGSLGLLKIDAEGFDANILRQVLELGRKRGLWPWQVQFEKNILSDWEMLDAQVIELHREGYRCRMTDVEAKILATLGGFTFFGNDGNGEKEGFDSEPLDDAMELRTLRRDDVLGKLEAGPPPDPPSPVAVAVADGLEAPEPEGIALRQSGQALSSGEGQCEASASPTGDVAAATTRMDGEAEELEAECEVLEAAAQSLKLSQQSSHLTELVSEGPGGPSLSEKPEAGLAWEVGEPISALHVPGQGSAGVQEVKAGTLQDSVSSPAHSAVTTPATSGYQTLPKGVDPVEVACDPVPGAVFTAEDEAVMGLKRRGGVEVVVEPPRAKAANALQREPLSARSARSREGDLGDPGLPSEARKPSSGDGSPPTPAGSGSLGLRGAPAPMVARPHAQGRPPRQPATPAGSAGSTESEQPSLPRRRTPSLGRRPSLPKADSARRSSSAGRSGNRKLVRNALEKYCLKGDANREQRELVLKSFDEDLERFDRFIILFRSIHTGRHDLRALYGFSEGSWSRVLQILPSPASLEERMVVQCLRYDSGGKEFKEVPASQEPLSVADAVFLHPQFLQRSRVVVP